MNKLVIFDLDGTILDSIKDIVVNINKMLERFGYETLKEKEIMQYIGNGAKNLVKRSIKINLSEEELEERLNYYNLIYTANPDKESRLFDGIDQVFIALKKRGYKLAVLTNKPQITTDRINEKHLKPFELDEVVGQRNGVPIKPDPTAVHAIMQKLNVSSENVYFVGDSEPDILTAKNAKIKCVSALWGYREKSQLEKVGATVFANTPTDLLNIIK